MEPFEALADRVESLSGELGFSEAALQALGEVRPEDLPSVEQIVSWALQAPSLAQQKDLEASFGDPPLTLVHRKTFHIQLLLWRQGSAAIHHHAFSGAFSVLRGESLHARYGFREEQKISDGFIVGNLQFWDCEHLKCGDVRTIVPGPSMIHSVFHIGQLSATLVVRTHHEASGSPQLAYTSELAYDPFVASPELTRKLQLLEMIADSGLEEYHEALALVLRTSDLGTSFAALRAYVKRVGHVKELDSLLTPVVEAHGDVAPAIRSALEGLLRESNIVSRREVLVDPGHRLFLALLLTIPKREDIFEILLSQGYDKPATLINRWLRQIAQLRVHTDWGASALGVSLDEAALEFLAGILSGANVEGALALCSDPRAGCIASLTLPRASILRPLFC